MTILLTLASIIAIMLPFRVNYITLLLTLSSTPDIILDPELIA
jgi:hypothetical protein